MVGGFFFFCSECKRKLISCVSFLFFFHSLTLRGTSLMDASLLATGTMHYRTGGEQYHHHHSGSSHASPFASSRYAYARIAALFLFISTYLIRPESTCPFGQHLVVAGLGARHANGDLHDAGFVMGLVATLTVGDVLSNCQRPPLSFPLCMPLRASFRPRRCGEHYLYPTLPITPLLIPQRSPEHLDSLVFVQA